MADFNIFGNQSTWNDLGQAASDLFAYGASGTKAAGDQAEAENYSRAATLASQNEQFTKESTSIKDVQAQRQIFQSIGGTQADVASAGLAESGGALDVLRSSAQQGALARAQVGAQGLITEAGYQEQAQSYQAMAAAADTAAQADKSAGFFDLLSGGVKAIEGIASIPGVGAALSL